MNRRTLIAALLAVTLTALVATGIGLLITHPDPVPTAAPLPPAATAAASTTSAPTTIAAPPPQLTIGRGGPAQLSDTERLDADQVALTVIAAVNSFDTVKDKAQIDGARRAGYLLAGDLAATLTTPKADGAGAEWQVWSYTKAWSQMVVIRAELPWALQADTITSAARVVVMKREIHTEGRTERQQAQTYQLTLTRPNADAGWTVRQIEVP